MTNYLLHVALSWFILTYHVEFEVGMACDLINHFFYFFLVSPSVEWVNKLSASDDFSWQGSPLLSCSLLMQSLQTSDTSRVYLSEYKSYTYWNVSAFVERHFQVVILIFGEPFYFSFSKKHISFWISRPSHRTVALL